MNWDNGSKIEGIKLPIYNFEISFGSKDFIHISQNVKRTLLNRFRYWMLCKFFPFKIERWDA